jgi:rhamnogalacturonyl hydrolase YesR
VEEPNRDGYARQFWMDTLFIAVALIAFFAAAILAVSILMV